MVEKKIFIFTDSFPFGAGEQFLETEIKELSQHTDAITIIPRKVYGPIRTIPPNVKVDLSYANFIKNRFTGLCTLLNKESISLVLKALQTSPSNLKKNLFELLKYVFQAVALKKWIKKKTTNKKLNYLLYTYWFDHGTFGCCLAKSSVRNLSVITRAHGYDIYEERGYLGTKIFREEQLGLIEKVFTVSENGANYLKIKHPKYSDKISVSRLGVLDSGFVTQPSPKQDFHIVSCSFVVEVKRVELIGKSLQRFAQLNPSIEVRWTHIGSGPLLEKLKTNLKPKDNFMPKFLGALENQEVIAFYKANKIDFFINLSTSEGIPVSIMEAQSCGIPAVATNVGGTSEIVNNENGYLLNKEVTIEEIVSLLKNMNKSQLKIKALKSKESWQNKYDASKNYNEFFYLLKA